MIISFLFASIIPFIASASAQDAYDLYESANKKGDEGDHLGAQILYNKVIKIKPDFASAYNKRGISKTALGKDEEAILDYNKAIKINPKFALAYNNRGISNNNLRKYKRALSDFNLALTLNPKLSSVYNNRGILKDDIGHYEGSENDFSIAIKIDPRYSDYYSNRSIPKKHRGHIYGATGSISDLSKFNELDPDPNFSETDYQAGAIVRKISFYRNNIVYFPELSCKDNCNYIKSAYSNWKIGDDSSAIKDANKAIEQQQNISYAYYLRGLSKSGINEVEESIADFTKAIEINPNFSLAYMNRGNRKLYTNKNCLGAISDYNKAIKIDPKLNIAYINRARAKTFSINCNPPESGNKEGAVLDYTEAIKIDPKDIISYLNRGLLKEEIGDLEGACKDLEKADFIVNKYVSELFKEKC